MEQLSFDFPKSLVAFNQMYGLQVSPVPILINSKRIKDFMSILLKELREGEDILRKMELLESMYKLHGTHAEDGQTVAWDNQAEMEMDVLTDMGDWLGDLQVYCGSEMLKWGLPVHPILQIIMESNMSKLGADGLPIVDSEGKVGKGPNYWKPEPKIQELLKTLTMDWQLQQMKLRMAQQTVALEDRQRAKPLGPNFSEPFGAADKQG